MQNVYKNWDHEGSLEKIGPRVQRFKIIKRNLCTNGSHPIKMQFGIKHEYDLKSIEKSVTKNIMQ